MDQLLSPGFRAFSAKLGQDPMRVQGPGGNTSIKADDVMWIKASGTELANAERDAIFVAVDRNAAKAEAAGAGDGTCKDTVLDPENSLRPSIETTFHAALDWTVVAHTHSVATLVHAISPEGRQAAARKLADLPVAMVPYAKPGLPLTAEILRVSTPDVRVFVLANHGLICCGDTVEETAALMDEIEARLALPRWAEAAPKGADRAGYERVEESWIAFDARIHEIATAGSYYPDHVVFLGPALPTKDTDDGAPAVLIPQSGLYVRDGATASQRAMVRCLSDCLARLPKEWSVEPIGAAAEAELLNWDAEKYRQALAARK